MDSCYRSEQKQFPLGEGRTIFDAAYFVPYEDRLRSLYGSVPHRISHRTAMAMAPAAIKAGLVVSVSGAPVEPERAERLRVRVFEEGVDTLLVGADPWRGATWMSKPERALLECLKCNQNIAAGEAVAAEVLHSGREVSPAAVVRLAHRLGWEKPLRRLASIAARMNNCRGVFRMMPEGFLAGSQRGLLEVPATSQDADWICVMPTCETEHTDPPVFRDEKYRVTWCWLHPHAFLEDLLY